MPFTLLTNKKDYILLYYKHMHKHIDSFVLRNIEIIVCLMNKLIWHSLNWCNSDDNNDNDNDNNNNNNNNNNKKLILTNILLLIWINCRNYYVLFLMLLLLYRKLHLSTGLESDCYSSYWKWLCFLGFND